MRRIAGPLSLGVLLGLAGGCATPLPGWRVSASVGGCEPHLRIVVADASGVVRSSITRSRRARQA